MYSDYGELISFASIDSAVDKLFKAYLDSKLVDFATPSPPAASLPAWRLPEDYWGKVTEFRRANLDPFTVPRTRSGLTWVQGVLSKEMREEAQNKLEAPQERERAKHARDYLYWFDIRAIYWSKTPLDSALRTLVVSADDLLKLQRAAKELQDRLQKVLDYERSLAKVPAAASFRDEPGARSSTLLICIVADKHSGADGGGHGTPVADRDRGVAGKKKREEEPTRPVPEPTKTP